MRFGGFIKAEEEELGDCFRGVVGGDQLFLRLRICFFAYQEFDVIVVYMFELRGVAAKRSEVVEEIEGCGRVFEGAREEGVVGTEEGDTV